MTSVSFVIVLFDTQSGAEHMPSLVIDFITPHLSELTDKTLWCFQRDLYQRLDEGFDFGDEFELQNWMNFLKDIDKEIEKRKTEGG